MTTAPPISDVRTFVGSRDFALERDFYAALGCTVEFDNGRVALIAAGTGRFYLQDYYQKQWCENTMLHFSVESAQDWYDFAIAAIEGGGFGEARVSPPKEEEYGAKVTYVWAPSGVLLHFAEFLERDAEQSD